MAADPARLYSLLLNTGLQQSNNKLYQVLHDLIAAVIDTNSSITSGASGGGGSVTNIVNEVLQLLPTDDTINGEDSLIPGPQGIPGSTGLTIPGLDGIDGEDAVIIPGNAGIIGKQGDVGFHFDGIDGDDSYIPGPIGLTGATGPTGPSGSGSGSVIPGQDGQDGDEQLPLFPGDIAYTNRRNIFIVNQLIKGLLPGLDILNTTGVAQVHVLSPSANQFVDSVNLTNDGVNWNLDDITLPGMLVTYIPTNQFGVYLATAGANPRPLIALFIVDISGNVTIFGNTSIAGNALIGTTPLAANIIGATITKDLTNPGTAPTQRLRGNQASYEILNAAATANWYFGIDDADTNAAYIGRGYGPNQGITPAIKIDQSDNICLGANITDARGTPTISSGFGGVGTIAGKVYAFVIGVTDIVSASGVVNFNVTFTNAPVVVVSSSLGGIVRVTAISTTQVTLGYVAGVQTIQVLVRGY